jgi:hypothetical protein
MVANNQTKRFRERVNDIGPREIGVSKQLPKTPREANGKVVEMVLKPIAAST